MSTADSSSHVNCGRSSEQLAKPHPGFLPSYPLDDPSQAKQLAFFKSATGIQDSEELKSHILKIREEACKRFDYPCIWVFDFLRGKVVNHFLYPRVLQTAQQRPGQQLIFIDLGACMGVDLRQAVYDGWNADDVLAVDVVDEWKNLGRQLFREGDRSIPFFLGDIFNPKVFDLSKPADLGPSVIDLRSLKDLNVLKGRAKFITANLFFHLFSEDDQKRIARYCVALLSDEPGSAIFGQQRGLSAKGFTPSLLFAHSPESWKGLWEEAFAPGQVEVKAFLEECPPGHVYESHLPGQLFVWLNWSVIRV